MTCSVISDSEMVLTWMKDGENIEGNSNYYQSNFRKTPFWIVGLMGSFSAYGNNVATLEILNSSRGDDGTYTCVARNEHGSSSTSALLTVKETLDSVPVTPTFTRAIREQYKASNDEATLECRIR